MRLLPLVLLLLGLAGLLFAYWGTATAAGKRTFDEMAGIIPLAVGLLGTLLVIAAAVAWWLRRRGP